MADIAKRVFFKGQVQGVGFRATALELSARYDVRGYVKNLPDGRVELFIEGQNAEIEDFISELQSERQSNISQIESDKARMEGYRDFHIAHE